MINHLETLAEEWLAYNGYFTRSAVKVGRRAKGGWEGEVDVVGFHPHRKHFVHIECSTDALTWPVREKRFRRKLAIGRKYAADIFSGMRLPRSLDQVVVHGFAGAADDHRNLGGGRLISSQELAAEIMNSVPKNFAKSAIPENFPLLRTLQLAVRAGAKVPAPVVRLISD